MSVNSYLKNLYQGALSARESLNQAQMQAEGWIVGSYNKKEATGPQAYYYVYDLPTGWTWMCSVPLDSAKHLSDDIHKNEEAWDAIRDGLGSLIYEKASGVSKNVNPNWEEDLALMVSAYSGTTQILKLSGGTEEHQHFIVINYRDSIKSRDSMLRPLIYPSPIKGALDHETFKEAVVHVINLDREVRPEWFKPLH